MMAIRPDYSVGTVSLAAGGTVVTGVGTLWAAADIQPGDTFKVQNLDAIILSIDSNTQITLLEPWTGTALPGASYAIRYQPDGSRYAAAARALIDLLGNGNLTAFASLVGALNMIPMFTGAGALTLVPRVELTQGVDYDVQVDTLAERAGYDGQAAGFTVLVSDVGDGRAAIYSKASGTLGDWTDPAFITGPSGSFQSKGTWSSATAYNLGDVVDYQGSSWIARVNNTNHVPPSLPTTINTWWTILSKAGSSFTYRGNYSGATAYLKDDVVTDQGSIWIALQPTTGNAPPLLPTNSNANWQLLVQGAGTFKGAYSGATSYKAGDIVFDQNSSWIALQATTGNAPPALPATSNANWNAFAVRGAGDVSGPASSVVGNIPIFSTTTGKVIADSGVPVRTAVLPNRIINSTMQISEENGTTSSTALGYYAADQWVQFYSGGCISSLQLVAGLTPNRSPFRLRQIITTAKASLTGTEFLGLFQPIEGVNVADTGWGTASALPIVVRFGVNFPAGTYTIVLRNAGVNRSFVKSFTITAGQAGVDTEFVIPVPGDIAGTWDTGVAVGIQFAIVVAAGPTYQTSTDGAWVAGDFRGLTGMTNGVAITTLTYEYFDVGLYLDPSGTGLAPQFVGPMRSEELQKCQRYYETLLFTDLFMMTRIDGAGQMGAVWWYNASKRVAPTVTFTSSGTGVSAYSSQRNGVEFLTSTMQSAAITSGKANARLL